MKQQAKETIGYIINGFSIALFAYLELALDVPDSLRPLRYLGWMLFSLGIALLVLSIVALVRNRGAGLTERSVYGLVRHPMYLGAMMCFFSYFLLRPHWIVFLISFVNVAVVYCFIVQGERQNITKFGDAYKRYMENVPRINLLAGIFRRLRRR